jgi:ribonucleoside-diphosphate reductase alpha chain
VSGGNQDLKELIIQKKFLFGGRTLANRGTNKGSYSNCYSDGYVPDSLDGILDTAKTLAMTYKAQGGQGISLSKIRPKGSSIGGKFKSDGIVPFMEIFNTVTESVSQGGSRKGALLMSLDINHPEAETFMTIKSDLKRINKANLSVEIDDAFMQKVLNCDSEANRLFNILATQACKYAEPGVILVNKFRNYNLMEFVDEYQIETCNPCGEQPLKPKNSCNLSSINLSEYVVNPFTNKAYIDLDALKHDILIYVQAMDDVLEENLPNHPLPEHRENAKTWRNLGIGYMGVHDMLIKLGIVYGSSESISVIGNLSNYIFRHAVFASSELAMQRGNFPGYDPKIWDAEIIKNNFSSEEIAFLKTQDKLRNCSLLSVAPTGSIGTMLSISTGVEPWFSKSYIRNTKSLHGDQEVSYEVWAPVIKQAMDLNWHPETLITANEIDWKGRIGIQAAIQSSCDTAISSTLNLSKTTTPDDIKKIYIEAWKQGLKGVTVYVDGSRDPILSTSKSEPKSESKVSLNTITPISRKTIGTTIGATHCKKCACGTLYITTNLDKDGNLVEVFTHTSKGGICQANLNAETRLISLGLRSGIKIEEIEDQLKGIHCPACQMAKAKGQPIDGMSCPDIISRTIKEFTDSGWTICSQYQEEKPIVADSTIETKDKCPECGEPLVRQSGCRSCPNCGFSYCG